MSILKHKYVNGSYSRKKVVKKNTSYYRINKKDIGSKNLEEITVKRYKLLSVIIVLFAIIVYFRLMQLTIIEHDKYSDLLVNATQRTITSSSAPRGRIYDRNYNLLVDNKAVKTIYYKKDKDVTSEREVELAYLISTKLEIDYSKVTDSMLREFFYIEHIDDVNERVSDKERKNENGRKKSLDDIKKIALTKISDEEVSSVNKEAAYIYYLMNKGYSYAEKIIKNKDVKEEEYAYISENIDSLSGFNTKLDWERIYLYGDTFKSILGNVSSDKQGIPKELANHYLELGYSLDDRVGISYLEYQYENYLKGTKAIYKVGDNNTYSLVSEGKRGNDIVLTIDIELQKRLESILTEEVLNTKYEANTGYYNRSFVVVSNPQTGEILAMSGKQVRKGDDGKYYVVDYTPGIVTLPVTPGSVVKGASILVGYKYNAIDIGTKLMDECIKIKNTPLKCSWRTMGLIDDVYALAYSSNVYQYKIAIKVGNGNYQYDKPLKISDDAFSKYRSMYASFGLGVKTGIDLPVESLGYSGKSKLSGHLLDYAIGQYDTYTPIQLSQYISTLANGGVRLEPYLLKEVYSPSSNPDTLLGDLIYAREKTILGVVDVEKKYIDRVRYGFNQVINNGIGYGYMGNYTNSAGKTGTSQSFLDTDNDGVVDTETISTSFVGYAPGDNPIMSLVVVSPDVSLPDANYTSQVTKRISSRVVNSFFDIYR